MSLRFPKSENLKSTKTIEQLFVEGKQLTVFPLKLFYIEQNNYERSRIGFAVPKKNFNKAVTRNRIKRQLREVYRLHKQLLTVNNGKKFALLLLYIGKDKPQYSDLEDSTKSLLKSFKDEVI